MEQRDNYTEQEFIDLLKMSHRHIFRVINLKTRSMDYEDQKDLAQDVMAKAWKYRHHCRRGTEANFRTWIACITSSAMIDRLRKLNSSLSQSEFGPNVRLDLEVEADGKLSLHDVIGSDEDHEKFISERQLLLEIDNFLTSYSKEKSWHKNLKVFYMVMHGAKYHEVADEMSMNIGTVKSLVYKVRRVVEDRFKDSWKKLYA